MDLIFHDKNGTLRVAQPDNFSQGPEALLRTAADTPYDYEADIVDTRSIKARIVRLSAEGKRIKHHLVVEVPHALDPVPALKAVASAAIQTVEREGGRLLHLQHHRWHSPQSPDLRHWLHSTWLVLTCWAKPYSGRIAAASIQN